MPGRTDFTSRRQADDRCLLGLVRAPRQYEKPKKSNSNKNWDCRRNFPSTLLILLRGRSEVGRGDAQTSLLLLVGWWPAPLRRGHRGRRGCARHKAHDLDAVLLELGLVCWAAGRSVSPHLQRRQQQQQQQDAPNVVDAVEEGDGDRLEEAAPDRPCRLNPCLLK